MAADTKSLNASIASTPAATDEPMPTRGVVFRYSMVDLLVIVGVGLLLCFAFRAGLEWLWVTWTTELEYSHGPLLPIIAAFLVWQQKDFLERLEFSGSWLGALLVVLSGIFYVVGVVGAVYTLQQYAMVLAVAGLALSLVGGAVFPRLIAPILILVLMIPQPNFILNNLSANLQLISSSLGVAFVRAMGISVFLEGNIIDLGGYRLQVVEACSGLRYLFPLMTIGLLIAYFYKGAMWKRVVVFCLSVPITILMNSLRVGTIGVMVEHWGVGMAEGFLHEFQGWMVFMLSAAILLGVTALLNRLGHESAPWRQLFGLEFPAPVPPGTMFQRRRLPTPFAAASLVVILIVVAGITIPRRAEIIPARETFVAFPLQFQGWSGHLTAMDSEVREWLSVDDYILADFADRAGDAVNFYVSYYNSQRDRRVVHSPRACIPGAGWHIEKIDQTSVPGISFRVNRMTVANGEARQLVYYWFDQRGRHLTNEFAVKWFLFWDGLTRRRTDGAMVRLVTTIGRNETVEKAEIRLADLARQVAPHLPKYVPR